MAAGRAWLGDHAGAFADAGEAAELGEQLGYCADAAGPWRCWPGSRPPADSTTTPAGPWRGPGRSPTGPAPPAVHAHQAITAAFCALCRGDLTEVATLLEARIAADGGIGSHGRAAGVAPAWSRPMWGWAGCRRRRPGPAVRRGHPPPAPPPTAALVARCRGAYRRRRRRRRRGLRGRSGRPRPRPGRLRGRPDPAAVRGQAPAGGAAHRRPRAAPGRPDAFAAMDLTAWAPAGGGRAGRHRGRPPDPAGRWPPSR